MDVRNVLNATLPVSIRERENTSPLERAVQTDSTTDREGNGQTPQGEGDQHHEPMSDEQLEKALHHIQNLGFVKENHLQVELLEMNGKRFIQIQEPGGKIVRRIPEVELWSLIQVKSNEKGQIISKTA